MDHLHCNFCFSLYCSEASECPVVHCVTGCSAKFHKCKEEDHALVCPQALVQCINVGNGCGVLVPRCRMSHHLMSCPAYVVICCFQWVRKMLQSSSPTHAHFMRKPKSCHKQLDMALTFYDQKRGKKKLDQYVGRDGLKACQTVEVGKDHFNFSYKYNPAHPKTGPLLWYRTDVESIKPVENGRRPLYLRQVPQYLQNCAAYIPPPPLDWTKPVAVKLPNKVKVHVTESTASCTPVCADNSTHEGEDECTRVETSFSCYNIIAINNLPRLHRTEASLHMTCGQLFRRDQMQSHLDTVHNRIMAGIMDGWMIERCPLAVYGCEYHHLRVRPKGGKHEIKFDDELGVFYVRSKVELPPPSSTLIPPLPAEIWCLIGQYCDSYTLFQLSLLSSLHHIVSLHLIHSRGLVTRRWEPSPRIPRLSWKQHSQVTVAGRTMVHINCLLAACPLYRWVDKKKMYFPKTPDWGLTASLTHEMEWELAPVQHISKHMAVCQFNIRNEHNNPDLASVYGTSPSGRDWDTDN